MNDKKYKLNDEGFSLVELIIVMAIMAVLVGVLAPQYIKYLEKTKKVSDCTTISTVLDVCETLAADPGVSWEMGIGGEVVLTFSDSGTTFQGDMGSAIEEFVPTSDAVLRTSDWGTIEISVTKISSSKVEFDITDDTQITLINKFSKTLAERLE